MTVPYVVSRCELDKLHRRYDRRTPREPEVMALVVTGGLNEQVASDLGTAEKAIKVHRARVMAPQCDRARR
jgi:FixJ family two-component response regulator